MTTILLAEDDPHLAQGIVRILEREGFTVIHASTGIDVAPLLNTHRPDLLILDVMMPKKDGFQILSDLRGRGDTIPVLMLTAKSQEADKVLGLGLGADDYLTKPFGVAELVARIKAQVRRANVQAERPVHTTMGALVMDFARQLVTCGAQSVELSTHENAILRLLVAHREELVPRRKLLDEVWGDESAVTTRVVDFHITNLRRKIEKLTGEPEPRRIITVHGSGYKLVS